MGFHPRLYAYDHPCLVRYPSGAHHCHPQPGQADSFSRLVQRFVVLECDILSIFSDLIDVVKTLTDTYIVCIIMSVMEIKWDPQKAETNFRKHNIRFSDAESVLFDPMPLTIEDQIINQ